MTCPIKTAKVLTPWWMMEILDYDGLELHPVRYLRWDDLPKPACDPFSNESLPTLKTAKYLSS